MSKSRLFSGTLGNDITNKDIVDSILHKVSQEQGALGNLAATSSAWYRYVNTYELTALASFSVAQQEVILTKLARRLTTLTDHYTHLPVHIMPHDNHAVLENYIIRQLFKFHYSGYHNNYLCGLTLACLGALRPALENKLMVTFHRSLHPSRVSNVLRNTFQTIMTQRDNLFTQRNTNFITNVRVSDIAEIKFKYLRQLAANTIGYQFSNSQPDYTRTRLTTFITDCLPEDISVEVLILLYRHGKVSSESYQHNLVRSPNFTLHSPEILQALLEIEESYFNVTISRESKAYDRRPGWMESLAKYLLAKEAAFAFEKLLNDYYLTYDILKRQVLMSVLLHLARHSHEHIKTVFTLLNKHSCLETNRTNHLSLLTCRDGESISSLFRMLNGLTRMLTGIDKYYAFAALMKLSSRLSHQRIQIVDLVPFAQAAARNKDLFALLLSSISSYLRANTPSIKKHIYTQFIVPFVRDLNENMARAVFTQLYKSFTNDDALVLMISIAKKMNRADLKVAMTDTIEKDLKQVEGKGPSSRKYIIDLNLSIATILNDNGYSISVLKDIAHYSGKSNIWDNIYFGAICQLLATIDVTAETLVLPIVEQLVKLRLLYKNSQTLPDHPITIKIDPDGTTFHIPTMAAMLNNFIYLEWILDSMTPIQAAAAVEKWSVILDPIQCQGSKTEREIALLMFECLFAKLPSEIFIKHVDRFIAIITNPSSEVNSTRQRAFIDRLLTLDAFDADDVVTILSKLWDNLTYYAQTDAVYISNNIRMLIAQHIGLPSHPANLDSAFQLLQTINNHRAPRAFLSARLPLWLEVNAAKANHSQALVVIDFIDALCNHSMESKLNVLISLTAEGVYKEQIDAMLKIIGCDNVFRIITNPNLGDLSEVKLIDVIAKALAIIFKHFHALSETQLVAMQRILFRTIFAPSFPTFMSVQYISSLLPTLTTAEFNDLFALMFNASYRGPSIHTCLKSEIARRLRAGEKIIEEAQILFDSSSISNTGKYYIRDLYTPLIDKNYFGSSHKEFLSSLSKLISDKKLSRSCILDIYRDLKQADGVFAFMHQPSYVRFEAPRFFLPRSSLDRSTYPRFNESYEQAIYMLRNAFQSLSEDNTATDREADISDLFEAYTNGTPIMMQTPHVSLKR